MLFYVYCLNWFHAFNISLLSFINSLSVTFPQPALPHSCCPSRHSFCVRFPSAVHSGSFGSFVSSTCSSVFKLLFMHTFLLAPPVFLYDSLFLCPVFLLSLACSSFCVLLINSHIVLILTPERLRVFFSFGFSHKLILFFLR